jgi:hypothetical protein
MASERRILTRRWLADPVAGFLQIYLAAIPTILLVPVDTPVPQVELPIAVAVSYTALSRDQEAEAAA